MNNLALIYYHQKKEMLMQCLNCSEELIRALGDWDKVPDIMSKKEKILLELNELESSTDLSVKSLVQEEHRQEFNDSINLIMNIDKKISSLIKEAQEELKESLRLTILGQKVVKYINQPIATIGKTLDYKE